MMKQKLFQNYRSRISKSRTKSEEGIKNAVLQLSNVKGKGKRFDVFHSHSMKMLGRCLQTGYRTLTLRADRPPSHMKHKNFHINIFWLITEYKNPYFLKLRTNMNN